MKIFQNKIVVGVICIVIAAILAFFFLPSISKSKSNTEKIFVVKNAVAEGTKIEESMLVEKEVGSYGLPQSIIKDKDKIIAITASIAGYHGLPACPSYSASKACVKAYGEALRLHLLEHNIQVNTICPGFIRSRITDKNTCPMPFFMEAEPAAELIAKRIQKNVGLIVFPWPMRLAVWALSILPNRISDFIYKRLPHKV